MSSGLDELERRGRWGRGAPPVPPQSKTARRTEPVPSKIAPTPKPALAPTRAERRTAAPPEPPEGVERVVIYLSREHTAWIRGRQIEALRAGKRVSASKLIRELMDRAMR